MNVLRRMGVPAATADEVEELPQADLIVDAVIGYSLSGAPRGAAARLIRRANVHTAPILSLDTPSGLDTTTGRVYDSDSRRFG